MPKAKVGGTAQGTKVLHSATAVEKGVRNAVVSGQGITDDLPMVVDALSPAVSETAPTKEATGAQGF